MASRHSVIAGTGSALPKRRVSNAELAEQIDTSDEWIVERTGIRFRYIAGEGETTGSLATDAARAAIAAAGMVPADIDLIVLATATPDQTFPATATIVQARLGIDDCVAFDVAAKIEYPAYAQGSGAELDSLVAEVHALGRRALAFVGDVRDSAAIQQAGIPLLHKPVRPAKLRALLQRKTQV